MKIQCNNNVRVKMKEVDGEGEERGAKEVSFGLNKRSLLLRPNNLLADLI